MRRPEREMAYIVPGPDMKFILIPPQDEGQIVGAMMGNGIVRQIGR
jgi:hypothetical protein